ncbi:MAG: 3'(2'),5'-bisphosphate nucleotidase CysQ [Syntrophobacteraceae bacterium]
MIDQEFLMRLAREAGKAILEVYGTCFTVEVKEDKSPVTLADKRSHEIIAEALAERYPDIPVLSEEGAEIPYPVRRDWSRFWLVDPLDGTKEFVKRNGEFTVNIALVEGDAPVTGLIYIPVTDVLYIGDVREGCREYSREGERALRMRPLRAGAPVRVAKSRSHPSSKLEALLKPLPSAETIDRGSALKFCALAAGDADFYPRFGPTWEWDTAAGQAIVTAAGGVMVDFEGRPFTYNKPNLLNGPFLAAPTMEWLEATHMFETARKLVEK